MYEYLRDVGKVKRVFPQYLFFGFRGEKMDPEIRKKIKDVLSYLASEILKAKKTRNPSRAEKLMVAFKLLSEEYESTSKEG